MLALGHEIGCMLLAALPQSVTTLPAAPFHGVRYPAMNAKGVATGDLDGDGHCDVAVARLHAVDLLWGDGSGNVTRRETLNLSSRGVTLADVDLDSDLDLIVWGLHGLAVLKNDGSSRFSAPDFSSLGRVVRDFECADLNGDSIPDGVAACHGPYGAPAAVVSLLGDGTGRFEFHQGLFAPEPSSVALDDLDGDGRIDLAVAPGGLLFQGDGGGGFAAAGTLANDGAVRIAIADADADGHPDVFLAHGDSVSVYFGDGAWGFPARTLVQSPYAYRFHVGDVDADGDVDMLVGDTTSFKLVVFSGNGHGAFASDQELDVGDTESPTRVIDLADLDADGQPDIVCANQHDVSFVIGDGVGGYEVPEVFGGAGGSCVEIADLDVDGDRDLVTGGPQVLLGDGDGGFASPITSPGPGGETMALGDLDGDGFGDLALADFYFHYMPPPPPQVTVLRLGDGLGFFPDTQTFELRGGSVDPTLADLDGDGDLDVIVGDKGGVSLLLGDGLGGFTPQLMDGPFSPYSHVVATAAADVDLDGRVDLVVASNEEELALLLGDGAGGFAAPEYFDVDVSAGMDSALCLALGDLDQDGRVDVFVAERQTGIAVLWGTPAGRFGPAERLRTTERLAQVRDLQIGDLDADGLPDLVAAYEGYYPQDMAGGLAVLRGRGDRSLEWTWSFGRGRGAWSAALADVDGDGRLDVATTTIDPGVLLLRNRLPAAPACTTELVTCPAKLNSSGCLPRLCSDGAPSLSGPGDFTVRAEGVLSHQVGQLFWGLAPATLPFGDGMLCVAGPLERLPGQDSGGVTGKNDCGGTYAFGFSPSYMAAQGFAPGLQVHVQVWSRDPYFPAPFGFGLTDALRFTVVP